MYITNIQPRLSETNGTGHISNTVVPVWLEAGITEINTLFIPDVDFAKWNLILAHSSIDYVGQLYYGKPAEVQTTIQKIGNSSFTIYQEIYQDHQLCVKAITVYVHFNYETQKPEAIPDSIRSELEKHKDE
ncbi:thioesterase family protein [Ammoniphilus sp. CFH 90114]|uniref:acyl-CoA thioesterase n=1 Tax=Ammoniphilus sp. CFH 90114 TaxID=2493665 RepID=UPI00100E3201|nr:thioesterase family protein [Ammoniphilus sp. CFH 90114]RXT07278.1 acyl-CoA thioesterase [Ammoniphilus sp. CFH 90114]